MNEIVSFERVLSAQDLQGVNINTKLEEGTPLGYRVYFSILSAKSLPARTRFICSKNRDINPFAAFTFEDIRVKSPIESKTENPVWNMPLVELGEVYRGTIRMIHIKVYDKQKLAKDILIGSTSIPVERFLETGPGNHQRWVKICKKQEGMKPGPVIGDILIKFRNDYLP